MDRKDGVKHSICLETKAAYRGDAPKLFGEMIKMMEALRDHAQKWKINPTGLSADEIKAVKVPEAFAFSFMVTWMLENSTEEFREFKKAIWGTAEMGRILPMFVPSTMFLFKGVKEKGHPLDTVEQLEATIKMLQKEMDELKTKFVPLANKIKKGRKVLGKLEKKLSAHINDTAPTCFETALKERQNNLPKVQQSRPTRIQTGDMFMESFVATVSDVNDMMTREKKIDVTHDEEETFSSKPKTKSKLKYLHF
jgi:regulator of replication initiation timing